MPEATRDFDNEVTPELALPLKEKLVAFRARHFEEKLPDVPKPAHGRLGDITRPILQIIKLVKPDRETVFLELIKEIQKGRLIEKSETLEAQILRIIKGLESKIEKGILPVKLITDTINIGRDEKYKYSYSRIGKVLSSLGFEKAKTGDGASAIIWNEQLLSITSQKYGLEYTPDISDTSETPEEFSVLENDKIYSLVKELRDKNDRFAPNFPLRSSKEFETGEAQTYLDIIKQYELDTKINDNRELSIELAQTLEELINSNQTEGSKNS
jgi:hypothetical protein